MGSPGKSPKSSATETDREAKPSMCILGGEKGADVQRSGILKSSCVLLREGLASSMWPVQVWEAQDGEVEGSRL